MQNIDSTGKSSWRRLLVLDTIWRTLSLDRQWGFSLFRAAGQSRVFFFFFKQTVQGSEPTWSFSDLRIMLTYFFFYVPQSTRKDFPTECKQPEWRKKWCWDEERRWEERDGGGGWWWEPSSPACATPKGQSEMGGQGQHGKRLVSHILVYHTLWRPNENGFLFS